MVQGSGLRILGLRIRVQG